MYQALIGLFLLCTCAMFANTTIYVSQGANGDGTSWESPMGCLQSAIAQATEGEQIWVAKGTYFPTNTTDRSISFILPEGVGIYGGFSGSETELSQRNISTNQTILSGSIGQAGPADNTYNVVYIKNASAKTILDGFTITAGAATGNGAENIRAISGAAIFNDGETAKSSPMIQNCTFKNNSARQGAAIFNFGLAGEASPVVVDCLFESNKADLDGGAIYNDTRKDGICQPTLVNCTFKDNMATYGAGIFSNAAGEGKVNLTVQNCTFSKNTAFLWGGGIYNHQQGGKLSMAIESCTFSENYPTDINKAYSTASAASK